MSRPPCYPPSDVAARAQRRQLGYIEGIRPALGLRESQPTFRFADSPAPPYSRIRRAANSDGCVRARDTAYDYHASSSGKYSLMMGA
eukprot:6336576-Pyramimonas_sp.AAC.1